MFKKISFVFINLFLFVSFSFASGVWETKLANDVIVSTNNFTGVIFDSTTIDVQTALNQIEIKSVSTTTLSGYAQLNSTQTFTGTNTFNGNVISTGSYFGDGSHLTGVSSGEPLFEASVSSNIVSGDITNWNGKVNRTGDTMTGSLIVNANITSTGTIKSANMSNSGTIYSTGTITSNGALAGTTLNTGQGANELYAMNANVRTTDSVTFKNLTATYGLVSSTGTITDFTVNDTLTYKEAIQQYIDAGNILYLHKNTVVMTESAAASDDLDWIIGEVSGALQAGNEITLTLFQSAYKVVIKHGTGNIFNSELKDITLATTDDSATLRYDGARWCVQNYNVTNPKVSNFTTDDLTVTYGVRISTGLVGTDANFTDFPSAKFISSQGNTGHTYTGTVGLVGEALATAGDTGTGVGGVAKTNGLNQGRGVSGVGKVNAAGDLGAAIGVYGRAEDTHAGGKNIGVYGYAINGGTNYSFYGSAGNIYNNGSAVLVGSISASSGTFAGDVTINTAGADGVIQLWNNAGSTTTYIASNTTSYFNGGNVIVGTTTVSLATSGFTVFEKDIRISTKTASGKGYYFQDNSFQTRAYAPVFVSSQNASTSINIASTSDVYVSTISITQIGGKNISVIGVLEYASDSVKKHTISLYRGSTLLQSWTHEIGTNDDEPLPIMYFKDTASTAGAVVYTIRVHSSAATGTQTVKNYNWRVRED